MSQILNKSLGPWMIWGLGVGYVISGLYFGWNLGLGAGGPLGLLGALCIVTVLYFCFTLSYAELAVAIPDAGGAFVFANRALGPKLGLIVGMAQAVEFIFAPPAIAAAIGAYVNLLFPHIPALGSAFVAYIIFTGLNIYGIKQSAIFELIVTVIAALGILLFVGVMLPQFSTANFLAVGEIPITGRIFRALPYAFWFYLGVEGIANIAEETEHPETDISRGFKRAMITLAILAFLNFFTFVGATGVAGGSSDSPLPFAMSWVLGSSHFLYHLIIWIGLCGLVASFHGLLLAAGRTTFEFGRLGYAPKFLGRVLEEKHTPAAALVFNMLIGFVALLTGKTGQIIVLAVFGALTLYAFSMLSLIRLRRSEPKLTRPYKTPYYPHLPVTTIALSLLCLAALTYDNPTIALIYCGLLLKGFSWRTFYVKKPKRSKST